MLTGYTCILPTHSLNCSTSKSAVRNLFSVLPIPQQIYTDMGPEFSKAFTVYLASLGIQHSGDIARRSQQQSSAENAIRLAKNLLLKIVSSKDFNRQNWDLALPYLSSTLNRQIHRNCTLARADLFLSPFFTNNTSTILENPLLEAQANFEKLNNIRTEKLLKNQIRWDKHQGKLYLKQGMLVTRMDEDILTENDSKANIPRVKNVYVIISLSKNNFAAEIENVRTGDRLSTTWNKLKRLTFTNLLTLNYDPHNAFQKALPKQGFFKKGNKNKVTLLDEEFVDFTGMQPLIPPVKPDSNINDEEIQLEEGDSSLDYGQTNEHNQDSRYNLRNRKITTQNIELKSELEFLQKSLTKELIKHKEHEFNQQEKLKNQDLDKRKTSTKISVQFGKISKKPSKNIEHIDGIPCERKSECTTCHENNNNYYETEIRIKTVEFIPKSILKVKHQKTLQIKDLIQYNTTELVAVKLALKHFINNSANKEQQQLIKYYTRLLNTDFNSNNFHKYIASPIEDKRKTKNNKKIKFHQKFQFWDCIRKPKLYRENWPEFENHISLNQSNIKLCTKFCTSLKELNCHL